MAEIGFNIVISILLLATVAYSISLSRKLSNLQKTKGELQHFLLEFDRSIQVAEQHISTLKALSQAADKSLKDQIEKARFLANDLSFLSEKGEAVADTLEVKIDQYRSLEQKEQHMRKASPAAMSPMKKQGAGGVTPSARKEAVKTPKKQESKEPMPAEMVMAKAALSKNNKESKQKAIEQLLQQIQSNRTPSRETVSSE